MNMLIFFNYPFSPALHYFTKIPYHYNVRYINSEQYFSKTFYFYNVRYLNSTRVKWKACKACE
jgi:hypothetical protein